MDYKKFQKVPKTYVSVVKNFQIDKICIDTKRSVTQHQKT